MHWDCYHPGRNNFHDWIAVRCKLSQSAQSGRIYCPSQTKPHCKLHTFSRNRKSSLGNTKINSIISTSSTFFQDLGGTMPTPSYADILSHVNTRCKWSKLQNDKKKKKNVICNFSNNNIGIFIVSINTKVEENYMSKKHVCACINIYCMLYILYTDRHTFKTYTHAQRDNSKQPQHHASQ